MNLDSTWLLKEIEHKKGEAVFSHDSIESIPQFKTSKERRSLENIAMQLDGHSPIKDFYFDKFKLKMWADQNDLYVFYDALERTYHFIRKHRDLIPHKPFKKS